MLTEQISSSYLAPNPSQQSRALESVAKKGSTEQCPGWRQSTELLEPPSAASFHRFRSGRVRLLSVLPSSGQILEPRRLSTHSGVVCL